MTVLSAGPDTPKWVERGLGSSLRQWCGLMMVLNVVLIVIYVGSWASIATFSGLVIMFWAALGNIWSGLAKRHRSVQPFNDERDASVGRHIAELYTNTLLSDHASLVFEAASGLSMKRRSLIPLQHASERATSAARETDPDTIAADQLTEDLETLAKRLRESK